MRRNRRCNAKARRSHRALLGGAAGDVPRVESIRIEEAFMQGMIFNLLNALKEAHWRTGSWFRALPC